MRSRRDASSQELNGSLQLALGKLGALDTIQKGVEEIKEYLRTNRKSEDKILQFLSSLTPNNEHMLSLSHKKEFIKLYGVMAEVLEGDAVPHLSRIFTALQKRLKEANPNLNDVISQSYGLIIHNTLHTLPDLPSSCSQLSLILKPLFEELTSSSKPLQVSSGLCVTKIIQHSPLECLRYMLDKISARLVQLLSVSRAQSQIIEAIISLILSVEQDFAPFTARTVPELLNYIGSEDFNCRKQVIDALYTLGAVVPQAVAPLAREIMNVLNKVRTDKVKPVRDSATEAINLFKKLVIETPPKNKVDLRSSKDEAKPKSIFRGPVNENFFKAANDDSVVEALERQVLIKEFVQEEDEESKKNASLEFREQDDDRIEKFELEEPAYHEMQDKGKSEQHKAFRVDSKFEELKNEFVQFRGQVKFEMQQINQRLGALEEMITTVTQLFDAKIKQVTCNPHIASLLRN